MPCTRRVSALVARLPAPRRRRAPATRFDWATPSSGPQPEHGVLTKHVLVSRDFATPQELGASREGFAESLREKAAACGLQVTGDMSFDVVRDYGGLPRGQRRAAGGDGCRLSRRDRRRWVIVRVWGRATSSAVP